MLLIRGASGAGKTALVLREFTEEFISHRRDGSSRFLRIVVPTATLVNHLRHELARADAVLPPSSVVSLSRFCAELAPAVRPVPPALLAAIVRDCLHRLRLHEFARLLDEESDPRRLRGDGLVSTVIETIALFENEGLTSAQLLNRKLHPLGRAFATLWREIDDAILERGFQARPALLRAAASALPPNSRIWLDGFIDLSPVEGDFVQALSESCHLTVTGPKGSGAASTFFSVEMELSGSGRDPQTTVVEASTPEREVAEIARRILALNSAGTPFSRIGIAMRDTSGYLTLLQSTFERFGIPARYYFGHSLASHPVAAFADGLITGTLTGWDHETALATFRAHPRWGQTADFDRFDFKVRETMPGRGAETLLALCESDRLRDELSACLRIANWPAAVLRPAVWQQRIERLISSLYRPGTLEDPQDYHAVAAARSHAAALKSWLAALSTVPAFWSDPDRSVTLESFWRIASIVVANSVFRIPDDRVAVVHVMSVHEARQWELGALFVCGVLDRDFPRRSAPNLFFPEAPQQGQDEAALFESLRTRATDALVLTYPTHDAAGKSTERSRFLTDLPAPESAQACRPESPTPQAPGGAGRIGAPELLSEITRLHRSVSMSSLENLAQCRFQFFAHKTLGLKGPPQRPGERLQPRVTGSMLHLALENWQKDRTRDFVELFEEAFETTCRAEKLPPGYRLEVRRIEFRQIARHVSAQDQWSSDSTEVEISLSLELSPGVTVNCRIDRLDIKGSACIIIDYKSGKVESLKEKLVSPSHLQGPLYALAVRESRQLNPVAVVFWAVRDDRLFGWGQIPDADKSLNSSLWPMPADWAIAARARVEERLAGFLNGAVTVHPEDPSLCRWCDFNTACRVEQRVEEEQLVEISAGGE